LSLHYFSYLSQAQKALYFKLGQALGCHQIPCGAPATDINTAIKALLMDHPMLCFFEGKWGYENGSVLPHYVMPPSNMQKLQDAAASVSQKFSQEAYPRQVYEWMLQWVTYDPAAPNSQNAYGALIQRQAVCKGIAKAYQLLMAQRKIDCILVEGTLDGRMKHVWNMIRLEGQWLHVDVTMGYPFFQQFVGAADAYGGYLKTTAEISRSHAIYHPEMLPQERQEGTHGARSM